MTTAPDRNSAITPPPPGPDLGRRAILQGAAWTIPAVAATTIAPIAAAASAAPVLTFNQPSYAGVACGTIAGAYITVTINGAPADGVTVSTTLNGGYTFSDGTQLNSRPSVNGRVDLPTINVPSTGGSAGIVSGSGAASATSSATAPFTGSPHRYVFVAASETGSTSNLTTTPAGSTPIGGFTFLSPTGALYFADGYYNNGNPIATGVSKAIGGATPTGDYAIEFVQVAQSAEDAPPGAKPPSSATSSTSTSYEIDHRQRDPPSSLHRIADTATRDPPRVGDGSLALAFG